MSTLPLSRSENYRVFEQLFKSGQAVVKLQSVVNTTIKDLDIPICYDDYRKRLETHKYTPLLYSVDFLTLFCYLFGLLNRSLGTIRSESFIGTWRVVGESKWRDLFILDPYLDSSL